MKSIRVQCNEKHITGTIPLSGSKSISNRALLIRALSQADFQIHHLSDSDDTITLQHLLTQKSGVLDAHHAGTTYRFMTAFLALQSGQFILTGSERMKQRPIKALVDALIHLGANIEYQGEPGFPPLKIETATGMWKNEISLPADISSQYISALLMIGPCLPQGLTIHLEGEMVSRPYIDMTVAMMAYFGVEVIWTGKSVYVTRQAYVSREFYVEADWSAASYYYALAGMSMSADITLIGLDQHSIQGDAGIVSIAKKLGVETIFGEHSVQIIKREDVQVPAFFEYNFINTPDIAQTIAVWLAGIGSSGLFSGLQTLRIKETDRIAALQQEFLKLGISLVKMPDKFSAKSGIEYYMIEGKAYPQETAEPEIETYKDHRMAMAFAILGVLFPIIILDPLVVNKSYAAFWKHLTQLGFELSVAE